jgi:Fe2+ transport system protein B
MPGIKNQKLLIISSLTSNGLSCLPAFHVPYVPGNIYSWGISYGMDRANWLPCQRVTGSRIWAEGSLKDLLINGIIGRSGRGNCIFAQYPYTFFFISLMEDTGYMARAPL